MNNQEIETLIAKHLSGEATPQENKAFRQWVNGNPQNKEEFNKIALTYQLSNSQVIDSQKSKILSKVRYYMNRDSEQIISKRQGTRIISLKTWVSIAASITILLSIGVFYKMNTNGQGQLGQELSKFVTKSNPAGEKSKVFLPDGSIVWLNSESSISYENEFNDSCRYVQLIGEAFFEVKKDSKRPFVVYSGSISTTALGTAFNIDAFNEDNITVSLTHGKVNVETNDNSGWNKGIVIDAGEGVVYNSESENGIDKILIDPSKVMMWRDGLLYLENATLSETIKTLERWYGVEIILNNKPNEKWSANGLFDDEYLDNVLRSLSFSQDFDFKIDGKQVFVTFKNEMPM